MKKADFIKLGLSEEQATACEKASLEELKGFIPKARFDEVNTSKKQLEDNLTDRDKQLDDLKKQVKDNADLTKQIEDLQASNRQIKLDNAVSMALMSSKARNIKAVKALLDLTNAELTDKGEVKGLSKQIEALQKSDSYLFNVDQAPEDASPAPTATPRGINPVDPVNGTDPTGNADFSKMTYTQMVDYLDSHPDAKLD